MQLDNPESGYYGAFQRASVYWLLLTLCVCAWVGLPALLQGQSFLGAGTLVGLGAAGFFAVIGVGLLFLFRAHYPVGWNACVLVAVLMIFKAANSLLGSPLPGMNAYIMKAIYVAMLLASVLFIKNAMRARSLYF